MSSVDRLKSIQNSLRPHAHTHVAMDNQAIILKNGTVLVHGDGDEVTAVKADVLIHGNKISQIGNVTDAPSNAETVDCTDKIVAPGFIE